LFTHLTYRNYLLNTMFLTFPVENCYLKFVFLFHNIKYLIDKKFTFHHIPMVVNVYLTV